MSDSETQLNEAEDRIVELKAEVKTLQLENSLSIVAMTRANELVKENQAKTKSLEAKTKSLEAKADRYHSALAVIYANPFEPNAAQIAENALYDVEDTDAGNNR